MTFLEELVKREIITQDQVSYVIRQANEKFNGNKDRALLSMELPVDSDELLNIKSEFLGIPRGVVNEIDLNSDLLKYISEDSAEYYHIAPISFRDGVLNVGVTDPENKESLDALQFISSKNGVPYKVFLISDKEFSEIMNNYKGIDTEVGQALSELDEELSKADEEITKQKREGLKKFEKMDEKKIVEEAPIIKIVAVTLRHAVEGGASDIHIENTGKKVKIRFRVDGLLHTSLLLPINVHSGVVARIKILSKLRLDEKRKPQDGGFSARIDGRKVDFRVSTFPTNFGEKVVIRILDTDRGVKKLDDLDIRPFQLEMMKNALKKPYGLILITGPTGSGKTTTLYSMLQELDREGKNVMSLEDPIEYQVENVNQSQVMPEIGYTFERGLRSIVRQDPDIILVGEIRDAETAKLAIQAALTGHLVLSTLHTNSATGVIPRLVDMGVDPYLIAPTLVLAIAQRLVRASCSDAVAEVPLDEATKVLYQKLFEDYPEQYKDQVTIGGTMLDTTSSATCPSGTKGRVAVFEMYEVDKEMHKVILNNPTEPAIFELARSRGMILMKEDALLKAINGKLPLKEVYKF
jgi:type IV pilus assembly protein PilB